MNPKKKPSNIDLIRTAIGIGDSFAREVIDAQHPESNVCLSNRQCRKTIVQGRDALDSLEKDLNGLVDIWHETIKALNNTKKSFPNNEDVITGMSKCLADLEKKLRL